ncbi:galactinol--sucrose galactosyltransferase [Ranunculus cassubicifolius]
MSSTFKPLHLHPISSFPNHTIFSNKSLYLHNKNNTWKKHSLYIRLSISANAITKQGNTLIANGKDVLKNIPENVILTPSSSTNGSIYLGATFDHESSRHIFNLGVLQDARLLSLYRFKMWWMIPRVGKSGSDVPIETQMLMLESKHEEDSTSYVVFLPVLDGEFRTSLQGNSSNELEVCVESGDPGTVTSQSPNAVFVNCGSSPFDLMKESMTILKKNMGTFSLRESKKMPGMLDWFGWCTWDAFYTEVNPQGIKEGLKGFSDGGTPARFLIIDDGWQDVSNDFQKEGEPFVEGSQFGGRLMSIKENSKFRKKANVATKEAAHDLKDFVTDIKTTFNLKYVYVWHALMGYWGGVHPDAPETKKYNSSLTYPVQSPGNLANIRDLSMDCMENYGVGIIDPARVSEFYDDLHSYLASQGVDGVKVDVQNLLETVASGRGGRVLLTRQFQKALETSIATNFKENDIICCMGQSTDSLYHSNRSAITRASDDYWPNDPKTQSLHIAAVAFNSIFLGEFVVPDWDMFYSNHYAAEFHAAARAVGGCGIYVSDKPGSHDFKLLKRLVLPDGSVLRARYPGRPSQDCLFTDPVMDGRSLLKIWNLNKHSGVLGVFNCQGSGTWPGLDPNVQDNSSFELSGHISPVDIEYLKEVSGYSGREDFAVFSFNTGLLCKLPKNGSLNVSLKVLQCDVFTVSPIKVYDEEVEFAAIGLVEMYNSAGAIEDVGSVQNSSKTVININGRGSGRFGAYSSKRPKYCTVNSTQQEFEFRGEDNLLTLMVPGGTRSWDISIFF